MSIKSITKAMGVREYINFRLLRSDRPMSFEEFKQAKLLERKVLHIIWHFTSLFMTYFAITNAVDSILDFLLLFLFIWSQLGMGFFLLMMAYAPKESSILHFGYPLIKRYDDYINEWYHEKQMVRREKEELDELYRRHVKNGE